MIDYEKVQLYFEKYKNLNVIEIHKIAVSEGWDIDFYVLVISIILENKNTFTDLEPIVVKKEFTWFHLFVIGIVGILIESIIFLLVK